MSRGCHYFLAIDGPGLAAAVRSTFTALRFQPPSGLQTETTGAVDCRAVLVSALRGLRDDDVLVVYAVGRHQDEGSPRPSDVYLPSTSATAGDVRCSV
jgi:hypothetical protein